MPDYVLYNGLPIPEFPLDLIDPNKDSQVVRVPFIMIQGTVYGSGAYVQIDKLSPFGVVEFTLTHVGLQPHLMMRA